MQRLPNGNGARAALIAAIAAVLVSVLGNVTVYLDGRAARIEAKQERHDRVVRENQFFRAQCYRDGVFASVVSQALADAERRAKLSLQGHPVERAKAVSAIRRTIEQLRILAGSCKSSIPD